MPFIKEDQLPRVLCGPMLRRVTSDSVSVFVATREKADVTLVVSDQAGAAEAGRASGATLQLGARLHVLVLEVRPDTPLVPGRTYTYNLNFAWEAADPSWPADDLWSLGLLAGEYPLGYFEQGLPSFSVPPELQRLKILHGSCRKPHGQGRDMLVVVDAFVEDSRPADPGDAAYPDPLNRPHQLLLTGDQIYADDVFTPLARAIREVGMHLCVPRTEAGAWQFDGSETLPLRDGAAGVRLDAARVEPGENRRDFVNEQTGFSNYKADGHLLFLAEFYAMYLLVWSDALWPREADGTFASLTVPPSPGTFCSRENETEPNEALREQFVAALPRARRALANVPTLMVFDDHEVTDDWNVTRAWRDRVMSSPAGRQVVRNALVAYAIFQHWGNRPEDFRPGRPGWSILQAASSQDGSTPTLLTEPHLLDSVLGLDAGTPLVFPPPDRLHWDYVVPASEHQILALDTRTWRRFPDEPNNPYGPPELISADALDMQLEGRVTRYSTDPDAPPGKLSIVISGAPVIGLPFIEAVQSFATSAGGPEGLPGAEMAPKPLDGIAAYLTGPEGPDNEAWAANRAGFQRMLKALARFGGVVVVSGDVHYSFTNYVDYLERRDGAVHRSRIVQSCSSALKNGSADLSGLLLKLPNFFSLDGHPKSADALYRTLQDRLRQVAALPGNDADAELQRAIQLSLLSLSMAEKTPRALLFRHDILRNNPLFRDVHELLTEVAAEERYRVYFLKDTTGSGELELRGWPAARPDYTSGDGLEVAVKASRVVVPFSNMCRLTFNPRRDYMTVELVWSLHPTKEEPATPGGPARERPLMCTRHRAPLAPPTPTEI